MKAYRDVALHPSSQPLLADDLVEFHLARIFLLLRLCGRSNRIAGLTKFAKLDFFVRYPDFFERARANAGSASATTPSTDARSQRGILDGSSSLWAVGQALLSTAVAARCHRSYQGGQIRSDLQYRTYRIAVSATLTGSARTMLSLLLPRTCRRSVRCSAERTARR